MASSLGSTLIQQDFLSITPFSELNNYQKIRVLGSGAFGKVYLMRLRERANITKPKDKYSEISAEKNCGTTNPIDCDVNEEEFAAKVQGFNGGPVLNRREASIMKRLVNPEV